MIILDRSFWLGLLLSAGSIFVLAHGLLGSGAMTTAALLSTTTAALILTGPWQRFSPNANDAGFAILLTFIALSFAAHGLGSDRKEIALLVLTLLGYPAARLMSNVKFSVLIVVLIVVVSIGTIVTLVALVEQWSSRHGKPMVFGLFDSAATQFATTLSVLLIFLTSQNLTLRKAIWIAAATALPTMVFTASQVRFSLLAMLAALTAVFFIGPRKQRLPTGFVILVSMIAMLAGALGRSSTTAVYFGQTAKTFGLDLGKAFEPPDSDPTLPLYTPGAPNVAPRPRPGCPEISTSNSVEIRQRLLEEAITLLPSAGITGIGFDGFQSRSCLPGYPVHNSFLQALIELGWPAGLALIALVALGLRPQAFALARTLPVARFAYCFLIFETLMSAVYGRVSRDSMLLIALGFAAAAIQQHTPNPIRLTPEDGTASRLPESLQSG